MRTYCLIFLMLLTGGCAPKGKMGKVKYGKDGAIESGSSNTRCTPPAKRYTKSVEAAVKGSIDSLSKVPKANLELGLKEAVTRLSDYSSDGLDVDLILFRVCEMANNRGLTAAQIDTLTRRTIDAWAQRKSSTFNVTNNGVNNGVMAGVLVVPEDKEIPLTDNFSVILLTDPELLNANKGKIIFEIRPRQGVWYQPFIGYPLEEDSLVNGQLTPSALASVTNKVSKNIDLMIEGKKVRYKYESASSNVPAKPDRGWLFICEKKPSILIFGEAGDVRKQYYQKLL